MVGCSTVSCDFGVFVKKGEFTSFYSTILLANHNYFILTVRTGHGTTD